MKEDVKILKRLYHRGKITLEGLQQAVRDGIITQEGLILITGGGAPQE